MVESSMQPTPASFTVQCSSSSADDATSAEVTKVPSDTSADVTKRNIYHPDEIRPGLFLGGLDTIPYISELGITHVLSVLRRALEYKDVVAHTNGLDLLTVDADDYKHFDLLKHIPMCVKFIQDALSGGGKVLVHCAVGVSRSATVTAAYLMVTEGLSAAEAIVAVRAKRPRINPNFGFLHQLQVFEQMACQVDLNHKAYTYFALAAATGDRWEFYRPFTPAAEHDIRQDGCTTYHCINCQHDLASSKDEVAPEARFPKEQYEWIVKMNSFAGSWLMADAVFIEPQDWMTRSVEYVEVGKLLCPGCRSVVGSFNKKGGVDGNGAWVSPAYQLHPKRIQCKGPSVQPAVDEQHLESAANRPLATLVSKTYDP